MPRRARGEGSITLRKDGLWAAVFSKTDPVTKRRVRVTKYGRTKADALAELKKLQEEAELGLQKHEHTVRTFLEDEWLPKLEGKVRASTLDSYSRVCRLYIAPHVGDILLTEVTPLVVESLLLKLAKLDMSARIRFMTHAVLHRAMKRAVKWHLIKTNPVDGVDRPKWDKAKFKVWTEEQMRDFLGCKAVEEHRLKPLFVVALTTGLRQGELLGLQWEDIDLVKSTLTVQNQMVEIRGKHGGLGEVKSVAGKRTLTLNQTCRDALIRQRACLLSEGLAANPLVFPTSNGTPYLKTNLVGTFKKLAKKAMVPKIRFHDLRHTNATLLIAEGVDIKTVSARLGHSQISITLDTYAKFIKAADEKAAASMEKLMTKKRS